LGFYDGLNYNFSFYGATILVVAGSVTTKTKELRRAKSLTQIGVKSMEEPKKEEIEMNLAQFLESGYHSVYKAIAKEPGKEAFLVIIHEGRGIILSEKRVAPDFKKEPIYTCFVLQSYEGWRGNDKDELEQIIEELKIQNDKDELEQIIEELKSQKKEK